MPRDEENAKRLSREWYIRNRELTLARAKAWAEANPEKASANKAAYRQRNREKHNEYNRGWFAENKAKRSMYTRNRQAAQLQRTPKWIDDEEMWLISEAYELAALRSEMTGFKWHVDHIIPLQGKKVSGLHCPLNLQVIPGHENCKKSASFNV